MNNLWSGDFLLENINTALFIIDRDEHIIKMNKAAQSLFEIHFEEIRNRTISELLPKLDFKQFEQPDNQMRRNIECESAQGHPLSLNITIIPVFSSENILEAKIFICTDISDKMILIRELMEANNQLRQTTDIIQEERDKFHLVIENISDGVIIMDNSFSILRINSALEGILGIKNEQALSTHLKVYYPEIFSTQLLQKRLYYRSEKIITYNRIDRLKRVMIVYLAPIIINNANNLNLALTIRDTTEQDIQIPD